MSRVGCFLVQVATVSCPGREGQMAVWVFWEEFDTNPMMGPPGTWFDDMVFFGAGFCFFFERIVKTSFWN